MEQPHAKPQLQRPLRLHPSRQTRQFQPCGAVARGAAVCAQPPHERFGKPLKYQAVKPHHPFHVTHGGGQRLYERIAPMFGGIQDELAALNDLGDTVRGRLRINAAENPAYYLIYPKVRSFLAAFPEVDVEILISNSWSDIVAQGFDFGVRPSSDVAQDMVAVLISSERAMCVVVAPDYLTRHGQPETPSELAQHRCIVPAFNAFNRLDDWEFFQNGQIHRVRVPTSLTFNSTALVKTAALDGLGLTWLPHYAVADKLASGALVELFSHECAVYSPMALYYPPNRHKTQAAEALIEWLKIEKVV